MMRTRYACRWLPMVLWGVVGTLIPIVTLLYGGSRMDMLQPPSTYNILHLEFPFRQHQVPLPVKTALAFPSLPLLPSRPPPPDPYTTLYEASRDVCTRPGKNVVLARVDFNTSFSSLPPVRPWSLHPNSSYHDPSLPPCPSPHALLQSLRLGHRLLVAPHTNDSATHFVPSGCNYRWYTSAEACEIAERYFSLTILGDSLSRHHMMGIFLLLTGDLIYGGLARRSLPRNVYENCVCDGQFSEHGACRLYSLAMATMPFPPIFGLCSSHPDFRFKYSSHETNFSYLCAPDPRPRFLLFQGGLHHGLDVNKTRQDLIEPTMALLNRAIAECEHKFPVRVVWSGVNSQAVFMNTKYAHQSDARAVLFNRDASEFVRAAYDVDWLDFINMTRNASVSDGLHFLTEVNLLKAVYLFNLMELYTKPAAVTWEA